MRAWFPIRWLGVGEPGDHLLIRGFSLAIWLGLDLFFHLVKRLHHRLGVPKTMQVVAFALALFFTGGLCARFAVAFGGALGIFFVSQNDVEAIAAVVGKTFSTFAWVD